jgi:rod shape-determining protein MreC
VLVLLNLPMQSARRARGYIRDALYPLENSFVSGFRRVSSVIGTFGHRAQLVSENAQLRRDLAEREYRIQELQHIRKENEALRQQLGFAILSPRTLLLAEVTARGDLSGWWQTVRINKGHRDGVLPDMAVITSQGLIGRTMDVTSRSSEILLITDPNSKLSARIDRNRALGIMQGAGTLSASNSGVELLASARPTEVHYLPAHDTIKTGDIVVTSGYGHVFPDGLPIGNIVDVKLHESGLYQQAEVQPFADLRDLQHVFVVLD